METIKIIKGNSEQEVWNQVESDLSNGSIDNYHVLIRLNDKEIEFIVDIDLGGGFEGGSEFAMMKSRLVVNDDFKFAIHDEHFIDEIGKFFGMQDMETGYEELDNHLIIKTNNENKARRIFDNNDIRNILISLDNFDCGIHTHTDDSQVEQHTLELYADESVSEAANLKNLFNVFYKLLIQIEKPV